MIEFQNISKIFKSDLLKEPFVALKDVSFQIPQEKIIGFLGANGAGKTTSLKILLDFIRPTSGRVIYSEILGSRKREIFANLAFLPERPYFYPHLTGRAYCQYMGKLMDMKPERITAQIDRWAPRFRIEFALDREIRGYSKGMLQRIGFLSSLLHDPKLVILDEPLAGVDPIGRKELKDIIVEINKEGKTVFFSSHIVSDMEEICHDVIFLTKGEIAYQGRVDELIVRHSKKEYSVSFLTEAGEFKNEVVAFEKKDDFIRSIYARGETLVSLNQNKPTLEEIFYNVRNYE